jgi:hypothetical protein
LLFGCDLFKKKEDKPIAEEIGNPLARVYTKYLYPKDIEGKLGNNYSKEDSAIIVQRYIDSWIIKQLMLLKAEAQVPEMDPEIQQKIMDCRNTLLIHEFEKGYLEKKLDTAVTEADLKNYYNKNINQFELKQNIAKAFFIKIPKDAPKIAKVKPLLLSDKPKDLKELKSYCVGFASHFVLEDTIWMNFDELIKNTPFNNISDKGDFLEKNRYYELTDDHFAYFLKIKDYKITKEISPYEFVRDQISNTLLNRKRIDLINLLKDNLLNEAKNKKEFEIYSEK